MATSKESDFDELDLTEFYDWEEFDKSTENLSNQDESETHLGLGLCICGLPSTETMLRCGSDSCATMYFHESCINLDKGHHVGGAVWLCESCQESATIKEGSSSGPAEETESSTEVPKRSGRGKMKYPKRTFKKINSSVLAIDMMKRAVTGVFEDKLFQLKTPLTATVLGLARDLEKSLGHIEFAKFSERVVGGMWQIAKELRHKDWTDQNKGEMWRKFHVFRGTDELSKQWGQLLDDMNIIRGEEEENFLLQHVLETSFQTLLLTILETDLPSTPEVTPRPMDVSEEQALRYCAGYVPFKLKKRYLNMKSNDVATEYARILSSWADNSDIDTHSLMDYTTEWIGLQNRGGLFKIRDDVFLFFKSVETVVRSTVHTSNIELLQSVNIQSLLLRKLECEAEVLSKWDCISAGLNKESSSKLRVEVLKCYIKMRCESFIKVYLYLRKSEDSKVSKKSEKALRKSLTS